MCRATHKCFETAIRENLLGDTRKAPWRKSRFSMVLQRNRKVSKREMHVVCSGDGRYFEASAGQDTWRQGDTKVCPVMMATCIYGEALHLLCRS